MKYAVVTGGTKGIGKAIVEMLLKKNYHVITNYAYDSDNAEKFLYDNKRYTGKLIIYKAELSSYDEVEEFVKKIRCNTKKIEVLVLNAAVTDRTDLYDINKEAWEYLVNTNINAPFYLIQKIGKMIENEKGRIIFIGSICGVYPHSVSIGYGVTKAAIHQMAKELVKFFAERKITVNAIIPGFVDTPRQQLKTPEQREQIEGKIALKRFAVPNEIASLCLEIIMNPYINGANLVIDGGYCFE